MQEDEKLCFSIDVKGGEKEKEYDDRGSMSVTINDKVGDCWMRLSLMSKIKQRVENHHQFEEEFM